MSGWQATFLIRVSVSEKGRSIEAKSRVPQAAQSLHVPVISGRWSLLPGRGVGLRRGASPNSASLCQASMLALSLGDWAKCRFFVILKCRCRVGYFPPQEALSTPSSSGSHRYEVWPFLMSAWGSNMNYAAAWEDGQSGPSDGRGLEARLVAPSREAAQATNPDAQARRRMPVPAKSTETKAAAHVRQSAEPIQPVAVDLQMALASTLGPEGRPLPGAAALLPVHARGCPVSYALTPPAGGRGRASRARGALTTRVWFRRPTPSPPGDLMQRPTCRP